MISYLMTKSFQTIKIAMYYAPNSHKKQTKREGRENVFKN